MKKTLFLVACLAFVFTSCSDKTDIDAFSSDVKEVLDVLNGTWVHEESLLGTLYSVETFVFTPFEKETKKYNNTLGWLIFHGRMYHSTEYLSSSQVYDGDYFFMVNTSNNVITAYVVSSDDEDYFSITSGKNYDYRIIDNNTITMHDQSLSATYNTNRFTRQ